MADRVIEELDENECLELDIARRDRPDRVRRPVRPAVLPVNYKVQDGAIVFRTAENGPLDEDLRTGIADADYKVAFEIDDIDTAARRGWSVLVQGPAHHVTGADEDAVRAAGVEPWAPGRPGAVRPDRPVPHHGPPRRSRLRQSDT